MTNPNPEEAILTACESLKEALLANYRATKAEDTAKVEKIRCRNEVLIAMGAINEVKNN
jgi:hypothetical protein